MKTYTIKPLEWKDFQHINRLQNEHFTIYTYDFFECQPCAKLKRINVGFIGDFGTLEAAKAKAQELHEQELAKYLQEVE